MPGRCQAATTYVQLGFIRRVYLNGARVYVCGCVCVYVCECACVYVIMCVYMCTYFLWLLWVIVLVSYLTCLIARYGVPDGNAVLPQQSWQQY